MRDNIGLLLLIVGIAMLGLGFIIGAFMLHWILGLITSGFVFITLAAFMISDGSDDFYDF